MTEEQEYEQKRRRSITYGEICYRIEALNDNVDCGLKDACQWVVDWAFDLESHMGRHELMAMFRALLDADSSYNVEAEQKKAIHDRYGPVF